MGDGSLPRPPGSRGAVERALFPHLRLATHLPGRRHHGRAGLPGSGGCAVALGDGDRAPAHERQGVGHVGGGLADVARLSAPQGTCDGRLQRRRLWWTIHRCGYRRLPGIPDLVARDLRRFGRALPCPRSGGPPGLDPRPPDAASAARAERCGVDVARNRGQRGGLPHISRSILRLARFRPRRLFDCGGCTGVCGLHLVGAAFERSARRSASRQISHPRAHASRDRDIRRHSHRRTDHAAGLSSICAAIRARSRDGSCSFRVW